MMLRIFFFLYLLALVLVSIIPIGSQELSNDLDPGHTIRLDHLIHFMVFVIPAWFMLLSHIINFPVFSTRPLTYYIALCSIIALISELIQMLVPYRTFNPKDMLANFTGVALGSLIVFLSLRKRDQA